MAAAVLLGFDDSTAALLFYEIVEGAGLLATLATRFEPRVHEARAMTSPLARARTASWVSSVTGGSREPASCIDRRIACPGPAR